MYDAGFLASKAETARTVQDFLRNERDAWVKAKTMLSQRLDFGGVNNA